jgi:hypothetical protein
VINVNHSHVDQVEYMLGQAMQGNHILFDPEIVRKVFRSGVTHPDRDLICKPMSDEEAYAVEPHIEKLLELPSLEQKRAYVDHLDSQTLENVVRVYFNIIENSLYESVSVRH